MWGVAGMQQQRGVFHDSLHPQRTKRRGGTRPEFDRATSGLRIGVQLPARSAGLSACSLVPPPRLHVPGALVPLAVGIALITKPELDVRPLSPHSQVLICSFGSQQPSLTPSPHHLTLFPTSVSHTLLCPYAGIAKARRGKTGAKAIPFMRSRVFASLQSRSTAFAPW